MTDDLHNKMVSSLVSAAWERAKGSLREMVALKGSLSSGSIADDGRFTFEVLSDDHIEPFIKSIEADELNL
jgi:hypothetical protein